MSDAGRVLVIDDDRAVRTGLAAALDEQGYAVVAVEGAESARRALHGVIAAAERGPRGAP